MAKGSKGVATRRRRSKGRKVSAMSARKKAAKRGKAKQGGSKVRPANVSARKKSPSKLAETKTARKKAGGPAVGLPIEETIIDVIEEPVPGTIMITEYETVRTSNSVSSGSETNRGPETEKE